MRMACSVTCLTNYVKNSTIDLKTLRRNQCSAVPFFLPPSMLKESADYLQLRLADPRDELRKMLRFSYIVV